MYLPQKTAHQNMEVSAGLTAGPLLVARLTRTENI